MNEVVKWQDQMKADAKSLLETERPALAIMSLKAGQMTIGGEPVPDNEIDCIIVACVSENTWYEDRFDPDVKTNPTCYAIGEGRSEDLIPYMESEKRQSDSCITCDKFQFGSDPAGGRAPACKRRRKMVLVPADGSAEQVILSIPPTSVKNWSNYAREIVVKSGLTPSAFVTKISVKPHVKNQFEVKFSAVAEVPEDVVQRIMSKKQEALQVLLAPYPPLEEQEDEKPKKKRKF